MLKSKIEENRASLVAMRTARSNAALAKLLPPAPIQPQAPDLPATISIDAEWLSERQQAHYADNANLIENVRKKIGETLASSAQFGPKELAALAASISTLAEASARLLGLKGNEKKPAKRTLGHAEII